MYRCTTLHHLTISPFHHYNIVPLHHSVITTFLHFNTWQYFILPHFLLRLHLTKSIFYLYNGILVNFIDFLRISCHKKNVFFRNFEWHMWRKMGLYINFLHGKRVVSNNLQVANNNPIKYSYKGWPRRRIT